MFVTAAVDFLDPKDDEHFDGRMFCDNLTCPCHEDDILIHQVYLYVLDGLMTPAEATDFVKGKGI